MVNITEINKKARDIKSKLGLASYPVGVKFIFDKMPAAGNAEILEGHRYCQALMKARHGEHVALDRKGISCPAAAGAFGFKPLPEGLKNGKGLMGFGITADVETGKEMFDGMTLLEPGKLKKLYLFPLETAVVEPDIVTVEDKIENLMWFALAYLNVKKGKRIESSTAILQAACVDAAIIPYKEQKMNLSYGCYGCRNATDIGQGETVLGFPFGDFEKVAESIEYLSMKAVPNSRGKNNFILLKKKSAEILRNNDIFQSSPEEG